MKLHLKGQISDRQQLLRQGSLPFPQHHISITAGSQLLQLSSVDYAVYYGLLISTDMTQQQIKNRNEQVKRVIMT
jgi:hypothetical protein